MRILNKREIKEIEDKIEETYGATNALKDFVVMVTGKRDKIWICSRDVFKVDLEKLRVNSLGLYFGRIDLGKIKISVEGVGIIGPKATKRIIELNDEQMWDFVRGLDVDNPGQENTTDWEYLLVKHKKDWMGIGRVEDGALKNALPKSRKIHSLTK